MRLCGYWLCVIAARVYYLKLNVRSRKNPLYFGQITEETRQRFGVHYSNRIIRFHAIIAYVVVVEQ